MPKWKGAYDSGRKYKKEWELKFPWIRKASSNSENAFCKVCHAEVEPRLSHLNRHEATLKHKQKLPSTSQATIQVAKTPRSLSLEISDPTKKAEIEITAAVACHCSIMTIDHLGEILGRYGHGSTLGFIKMHRTKCSALIQKCIAPALKEELRNGIAGKKYVVIIDESTDVASQKLLCAVVSYVSDTVGPVTDFLSLIPVVDTSAGTLFQALKEELLSYGMELSNCIGFASDGASVMVGQNNSVWTRIKEVSPDCVQMKCICHSLALCIQRAFAELPSNLGYLLKEIPAWFSHSTLRRAAFKSLFDVMNADSGLQSGVSVQTPFERLSTTRWLVRGKVMGNILANWEELLGYFMVVEQSLKSQPDAKFKARLLKEMLNDRFNFLLLHFATPVVQEFERLNALFQTDKADPHKLYKELELHHKSLISRIYTTDGKKKELEDVEFGYKFTNECSKYVLEFVANEQQRQSVEERVRHTKERCLSMLEVACEQVKLRLPSTKDMFKGLSQLSPAKVLNQVDKPAFSSLPFLHLVKSDLVEDQYRRLTFIDWSDAEAFKTTGLPSDTHTFWFGVMKTPGFEELGQYVMNCLIVPSSNAVIERVFSLVTATKTKPRNRMGVLCLDAIIRIKSHLQQRSKCCKDFVATSKMIALHNTKVLYTKSDEKDEEQQEECIQQFL